MDLMHFKKRYTLVIVERKFRGCFVAIQRTKSSNETTINVLEIMRDKKARTHTCDNGTENSQHDTIRKLPICFCAPGSPSRKARLRV